MKWISSSSSSSSSSITGSNPWTPTSSMTPLLSLSSVYTLFKMLLLVYLINLGGFVNNSNSNNGINNGLVMGFPAPNQQYLLYSERRATRQFGNLTVFAGESNIQISVLTEFLGMRWQLIKDGWSVLVNSRIENIQGMGSFNLRCVTTYDSGVYSFMQQDPLNTGFNIQTAYFRLNVIGNNSMDQLEIIEKPKRVGQNGVSLGEVMVQYKNVYDHEIEPIIITSPNSQSSVSKKSGINNNIISYTRKVVDRENYSVKFIGLNILGESGDYTIGFVSSSTCTMAILDQPVTIVTLWTNLAVTFGIGYFISVMMIVLAVLIRVCYHWKKGGMVTMVGIKQSVNTHIDHVMGRNGSLRLYFKFLRLFILQSFIFIVVGLVGLLPISMEGDNEFTDILAWSQANWSSDSQFLFIYQAITLLIFVSLVILYTRFNGERVFQSHDTNHLVTSRSVFVTGLPKSLIDCTILKEYLQTGYSNGIFSLSLVLEKRFTTKDKLNDLDGRTEGIFTSADSKEKTIRSTGSAFITFSCVSDAHLFKTQFSPHKWGWAKEVSPIPPKHYQNELQMKRWKAYPAPPLSDVLWTKLHDPTGTQSKFTTILLIIITNIICCSLSFLSVLIFVSQYDRIHKASINTHAKNSVLVSFSGFWIPIFLPCNILLILNRTIPTVIKKIMEQSSTHIRSIIKSQTMIIGFYTQIISIVFVPSLYFIITMGYGNFGAPNTFFLHIDFFKTGGLFYIYFIIYYSVVSPVMDCTCIGSSIEKIINLAKGNDIGDRCIDLSSQYCNVLLLVLLVSIYAPIFPLLFPLTGLYLLKKYYFDKYKVISVGKHTPPSDRLLIAPLQHCTWLVLTLVAIFYFFYVLRYNRGDLSFIYAFLVLIGFGRYIPSCSHSVCYSVCDGAMLPCIDLVSDSPNSNTSQEDQTGDEYDDDEAFVMDETEMKDLKQQQQDGNLSNSNNNNINSEYIDENHQVKMVNFNDEGSDLSNNSSYNINGTKSDRETILNIQQNYSTTSGGIFSFLYRWKLPKPRSITITQYISPFYSTKRSKCTIIEN